MNLSSFNSSSRKLLTFSKRLYIAAFLGTTVYCAGDYLINNRSRISDEKTVQHLEFHRYSVEIGDTKKQLTLVGENHLYTAAENRMGQLLINSHDSFASEAGDRELSTSSKVYSFFLAIPYPITGFYYRFGSGRFYQSISDMVREKNLALHSLDADPFIPLSSTEKASFLIDSYKGLVVAPYGYFEGKFEKPYSSHSLPETSYKHSLIDVRSDSMSTNILHLMQRNDVNNLLVTVGRAHLEGIITQLSTQLPLHEVESSSY